MPTAGPVLGFNGHDWNLHGRCTAPFTEMRLHCQQGMNVAPAATHISRLLVGDRCEVATECLSDVRRVATGLAYLGLAC